MRTWWRRLGDLPTLDDRFSPRHNAMGLIRLILAFGVLVAHSWTLGFGWPGLGPLGTSTRAQFNSLTVYGFFVISGFLITGSALKTRPRTFAWHRVLRIFPGYWVCLIVTALILAPVAAWYEGSTDFWSHAGGPWAYLWTNWFTSMEQYGISGLLTTTPYGQIIDGSVFNGSLWSLKYELACYVVVGTLAALGVLRRSPRLILWAAIAVFLVIAIGFSVTVNEMPRPVFPGAVGPFALVGSFNVNQTVYLAFVFLLGAVARLYADRIPMHGSLAIVAVVALLVSLFSEGYVIIGLPAYAYLLLYAAAAAPSPLCTVGRRRDYSYGVYLYSFPVQQVLALVGGARWGLLVFILLSVAITLALAVLSWHFVERPAMRLKNGVNLRRRPSQLPASAR